MSLSYMQFQMYVACLWCGLVCAATDVFQKVLKAFPVSLPLSLLISQWETEKRLCLFYIIVFFNLMDITVQKVLGQWHILLSLLFAPVVTM